MQRHKFKNILTLSGCTGYMAHISRSNHGFTLVELAIVMIIIGLLIGGVLKGQELIFNSKVTATVGEYKGIVSAVQTFRDNYRALPGDLFRPWRKLPNCTALPCRSQSRHSDSQINGQPGAALTNLGNPRLAAWAQMAAVDLITGVTPESTTFVLGQTIPSASMGGSFKIGYTADGNMRLLRAPTRVGHYILLSYSGVDPLRATNAGFNGSEVMRLDTKIDDGKPLTGSAVLGGAGVCLRGSDYRTSRNRSNESRCGIYLRL